MNLNPKTYGSRTAGVLYEVFRFAAGMGHGFAGSEHVLWGIACEQGRAAAVLRKHGLEPDLIEEYIKRYDQDAAESGGVQAIQLSEEMQQVLMAAEEAAKKKGEKTVEPEHLLLGILEKKESAAVQMLRSLGADPKEIKAELTAAWQPPDIKAAREEKKKEKTSQFLSKFTRDLTAEASSGKLDPMIGREDVIERLVQILSRRTKNNPALIGEPGVGKTAVAEGLAQRIAADHVPENLRGKRLLSFDLAAMVAGTRFRGDFEERLKGFVEEIKEDGQVLLFIDEFHTLIGAGNGANEPMDAANILKQALGRGEIQVIGATTLREYRQHIEKDAAMERRFQPVMVEEPDEEDAIRILTGLRGQYEEFHGLRITDEAVRAAVELSSRYIQDRFLPDKAIDLMDEAASRIRVRGMEVPTHLKELDREIQEIDREKKAAADAQEYERAAVLRDRQALLAQELTEKQEAWRKEKSGAVVKEDVAEVVSSWTKIPVTMLTQDERKRLLGLEDLLKKRVIGQDEAVAAVSRAIRRSRTGVAEPGRPAGAFLFLGPTGVGKTEVSRALAEVLFQDENAMIRLDMSEFMESHAAAKLIGAPPGYVGYDEGGQLTEQVRRKPYSIILIDEIEKAHPDVWNVLLQIMDDGRLTDSQGRTVSFKNTILIMTSNIGAKNILGKKALGFFPNDEIQDEQQEKIVQDRVMEELKRTFQPEFLNRLDEILVFKRLEKKDILTIARNMTERLTARLKKQGIHLQVQDSAVELLAEKGFDPIYGARPLRRAVQTLLENAVADRILENDLTDDIKLIAEGKNGKIKLEVKRETPKREFVLV